MPATMPLANEVFGGRGAVGGTWLDRSYVGGPNSAAPPCGDPNDSCAGGSGGEGGVWLVWPERENRPSFPSRFGTVLSCLNARALHQ